MKQTKNCWKSFQECVIWCQVEFTRLWLRCPHRSFGFLPCFLYRADDLSRNGRHTSALETFHNCCELYCDIWLVYVNRETSSLRFSSSTTVGYVVCWFADNTVAVASIRLTQSLVLQKSSDLRFIFFSGRWCCLFSVQSQSSSHASLVDHRTRVSLSLDWHRNDSREHLGWRWYCSLVSTRASINSNRWRCFFIMKS